MLSAAAVFAGLLAPSRPAAADDLRQRVEAVARDIAPLVQILSETQKCFVSGPALALQAIDALRRKNFGEAAKRAIDSQCLRNILIIARNNGYQTITIGSGFGGGAIASAAVETGIALDVQDRYKPVGYHSEDASVGGAFGGSAGVSIGLQQGGLETVAGVSKGYTLSIKAVGIGVWFTDNLRFNGVSTSLSAGGGVDFGSLHRQHTRLLTPLEILDVPLFAGAFPDLPVAGEHIVNNRSQRCLDVAENRDGGRVVIANCGPTNTHFFQNWQLIGLQVRNPRSGLCLDVAENRDGGRVVIARCGNAQTRPYQFWDVYSSQEPARRLNKRSGMCLDVGENRDGGKVVIARCEPRQQRIYQLWGLLTASAMPTPHEASRPQPPAPPSAPKTPAGTNLPFFRIY